MGSFALILIFVLGSSLITNNGVNAQYSYETARLDMPRDDEVVVDMTKRVLTRREKGRLNRIIRKDLSDVDLQIVVASNVEHDSTPKETATTLFNAWEMGSSPDHVGGVLVFLAMEENRIEIEFSDSLGHILSEDWCHELLYAHIVPYFREECFADGLEQVLLALNEKLRERRHVSTKHQSRRRKRRRRLAGLAALAGGGAYATRPYWDYYEEDEHSEDDPDLPPDGYQRRRWPRNRKRRPSTRRYNRRQPMFEERVPRRSFFDCVNQAAFGQHGFFTGKTGGNNVNIMLKPSPPRVESSRSATSTTVEPDRAGERILGQDQAQEKTPQTQEQKTTGSTKTAFMPRSSNSSTVQSSIRRALSERSNDVSRQKSNITPSKTHSSGLGAGASWTSAASKPKWIGPMSSSKSSSGMGGGASWSTAPKAQSRSSAGSSSSHSKKRSSDSHKSSGKGSGASW